MTPEEITREVKRVPHYKEPFKSNNIEVGYPFDLDVAVRTFGREIIPEALGIYHLFYKGRLVYIGMSKNLRGRLLYHLKDPDKVFDGVLWFDCNDRSIENVLNIESKLIRRHMPPLNIECISGGY
jgi:hypothetical protein